MLKYNKLLLAPIFFIFLFSLSFISAFDFTSTELLNLGTFKQNDCVTLYQTCASCSYVNLTSVKLPNGTIVGYNDAMTKDGSEYSYDYCNTSLTGQYFYTIKGDKGGTETSEVILFGITYYGKEMSTSQSILSGFMLLVFVFFMLSLIFFINKLPKYNSVDEEGRLISINWLKYARAPLWFVEWMLLIGILFLSSNLSFAYLGDELFAQILHTLFRVLFGFTPIIVVVWIVWIFTKIFHDKEMQKLLDRGIFPGEYRI
jgi:hypothetical protein